MNYTKQGTIRRKMEQRFEKVTATIKLSSEKEEEVFSGLLGKYGWMEEIPMWLLGIKEATHTGLVCNSRQTKLEMYFENALYFFSLASRKRAFSTILLHTEENLSSLREDRDL